MVAHTSNLSTWELEAGGFNLRPAWSILSQEKKEKKKKAYRNKMWVKYFFSLPKEMKLFSRSKLISSWAESSSHMDLNKGLKRQSREVPILCFLWCAVPTLFLPPLY